MITTQTDSKSTYPMNPDEPTWIAQARQGNQAAFSNIVEVYQKPIYNLCHRMLGDRTEAEDAAQETFIRAYFKLDSYDEKRKFSSWLFSIASHHCIDKLRKRRIQWISWDELPPWRWLPDTNAPQPEENMIAYEATQEVHALLDSLAPDYRAAVVLKYWHNFSYEEIAESLNTTVSAIKSKLFRARRMMAKTASEPENQQMTPSKIALVKLKA